MMELRQKCARLKQKIDRLGDQQLEFMKRERELKEKNERLKKKNKKLKKVEKILLLTRQVKDMKVKDFKIGRVLGRGSHSIVFHVEAKDLPNTFANTFALKMILNLQQIETNVLGNEYMNERNSSCVHPNIIHILSEFTDKPTEEMIKNADPSIREFLVRFNHQTEEETPITTQFFLIEFHPLTLEDLCKSSKLSVDRVLKYSRQLLDCFSFLFDNHIVHRDVKMANILVSFEDNLILNDFGESVTTDINHCCERWKLRAGNMRYQAPEILNALPASQANIFHFVGQYSWEVGCLMFELIAGEFPFPGYPCGFGKAPNIRVEKVNFDARVFADYDKDLLALIGSLLENDVAKRMRIKDALKKFDEIQWRRSED